MGLERIAPWRLETHLGKKKIASSVPLTTALEDQRAHARARFEVELGFKAGIAERPQRMP